jgi:hypothetical protein
MSAKVRVVVEVEVWLPSPWGDDCTVGQVRVQARREATQAVQNIIGTDARMRIVRLQAPIITVEGEAS